MSGIRLALPGIGLALLLALCFIPGLEPLRAHPGLMPIWLHTAIEVFAVCVAAMVFAVIWHAYRPERPATVVLLACGFLASALLDLGHLLSYESMPPFAGEGSAQKSIAFWLMARAATAISLLIVAFGAWRPLANPASRHAVLAATLLAVALAYALVLFWPQVLPDFYRPAQGLTPAKIGAEAVLIVLVAIVTLRLWRHRTALGPLDVQGLITASLLWVLGELGMVAYAQVDDALILLGHLFKAAAYFLIYRLVFVASVRAPYQRLAEAMERSQAAEAQIEALAYYDLLTGLPNKALLRERSQQGLLARSFQDSQAALLLLNLDGFKQINDSLGHRSGDQVLRAMAARLPRCVESNDTVARLGGDEFALFLQHVRDAEDVVSVGERILRELAQPLSVVGQELRTTVSIGVAMAPADGRDFDELFQRAGTALHRAKEGGGNRWRFYDAGMNREALERLELRNGLRLALERGEFELHYQPQVALADGRVVGVEALLRWRRPGQCLVGPAGFIAEAESSGLIVPIGRWVLQAACRQAADWLAAGLDVPVVCVNLSARQFQQGEVEQDVAGALAAAALPAERLELELTESILIQDAAAAQTTLNRLKAMGLRLAIDDFGTGYSSLAYLRDLPIDKLKIDQSFVREMGARSDGEALVATIIQLAASLRLGTVAEGVENAEIAARLMRLGCAEAQGFHYARPMPAEALTAFLRERS